jgi:small conductance mechanosensitive channel
MNRPRRLLTLLIGTALVGLAVTGVRGDGGARAERLREELRATPRNLGELFESLADAFFARLPGAIAGLAILALFWVLARFTVRIAGEVMERAHADLEARELLLPLLRFCVLVIGFLMALDQMGFEVSSLLAGLGIAGLAVGLAAQETIANLIAGLSILWDRPFRLGDFVTVAGAQGEVTEIGLRSIRLRTLEQREVILPNKEVVRQAIVNHSRYPVVRITAAMTLAHGASVDAARAAILAAVKREMEIVDDPAPQVLVTALGDLGTGIEARAWIVRPETPVRSPFRLLEVSRAALEAAGVELARGSRLDAGSGGGT